MTPQQTPAYRCRLCGGETFGDPCPCLDPAPKLERFRVLVTITETFEVVVDAPDEATAKALVQRERCHVGLDHYSYRTLDDKWKVEQLPPDCDTDADLSANGMGPEALTDLMVEYGVDE